MVAYDAWMKSFRQLTLTKQNRKSITQIGNTKVFFVNYLLPISSSDVHSWKRNAH